MRLINVLLLGLAGAVATAADQKEEPAQKELAKLQGNWRMVSVEINGRTIEYPEGSQPKWQVKANKLVNAQDGKEWASFTIDPSAALKVLDVTGVESKQTREAIYTLDGDTWTICINQTEGAKERPSRFSTKDQANWKVWVLKREKPADP